MLAAGELMVVETEDDWFLGTVEVAGDALIVGSGFVGRPVVLCAGCLADRAGCGVPRELG